MNVDIREITEDKSEIYLDFIDYKNIYRKFHLNKIDHHNNPYHLLLCAKSAYVQRDYELTLATIAKIQPSYSTKILYERQALLIKALYLKNDKNWQQAIQKAVQEFQIYEKKCPGEKILGSHRSEIKSLQQTALLAKQPKKQFDKLKKKQIETEIKQLTHKANFEGFPCYLISQEWNKNFSRYILLDDQHPGPITNFQLINHIFQHQKDPRAYKTYTDVLMFPFQNRIDFYVIGRQHWLYIQKIFKGNPIKRLYLHKKYEDEGDNLIKALCEIKGSTVIYQWQKSLYWQKSVFPFMIKAFGPGQMKQQTKNKQFLVIQPGLIKQPERKLKYVNIDDSKIEAHSPIEIGRKNKILMSFDLQCYRMKESKSHGKVGLTNLGNTCYMNSALQCLSQITEFSQFFVQNHYLEKLNLSDTNIHGSYGQITCALADIFKRLWFCSQETKQIDPIPFKRVFGHRYVDFQGYEQQDSQEFLMFLLNCIHDDMNERANIKLPRQSVTGKSMQDVRNSSINHHIRHNKSIISQKFIGFHSETINCNVCNETSHRFEDFIMFHIQVPQDSPILELYFIKYDRNPQEGLKLSFFIEEMNKFREICDEIYKEFQIPQDHKLYSLIYDNDFNVKIELNENEEVAQIHRDIHKKKSELHYIFVYEVRKLSREEDLALVTYHFGGGQSTMSRYGSGEHLVDSFPRLIPLPADMKDSKNLNEDALKEWVCQEAIPKSKYSMISKQQIREKIKKVSLKSSKGTLYQTLVSVKTRKKLSYFKFTSYEKTLGTSSRNNQNTLQSCLAGMSQNQIIEESEGWFCGKCREIRQAHKADKIYSTNDILLFDFKRFTQKGKITTKIQYPVSDFDITPFIQDRKQRLIYDLAGVVLHRGSLDFGHYTAYCKNEHDKKWHHYDDELVREVGQDSIVDQNAYILMYKRKR